MKVLKKFASIIIAVCLMIPVLSTVVFAADGVLMFSDPSTKVGENVSVDFVVQSSGGTIGSVDVTMSYDPKALEFVSGDGFTADGAGTLTYKGTGGGTELRTAVVFRALTVANTQISVSSSSATISSGDTLNLNNGSSAISIAAADDGTTSVEPTSAPNSPAGESTDIVVTVDGNDYHFSEAFTTTDIPEGYSETKMTFNGEERKFVANDAGVYLGFLMDDAGKGKFFLFNTDDNGCPTTDTTEKAGYFEMGPNDHGENARRDMVLTLEDMGFEIEASHHEAAPGQHEIDIRYQPAKHAADNIMTYKLAVKTIAKRH